MAGRLAEAARKLLERLDVIEEREINALERAIYKVIRGAALEYGVDMQALWEEARTVERDPVERHRPFIGAAWRPSLR